MPTSQDDISRERAGLSAIKRALLEKRLRGELADTARPRGISRRAERGAAPMSYAQQRLWFLDQLMPGSPLYNIPAVVRFDGSLDVAAFGQSLAEIVRRHEALRTTFKVIQGQPVQVISPVLAVEMPVIDLQGLPADQRATEVQRLAQDEAQRPFDLAQGPLVRTTLLRLGETEHILFLTAHHIAYDGWSMGVFLRELTALYAAFSQGQPSPLAELPVQVADFAIWQREWLREQSLDDQLAYWRERLAGAPALLELPTDRPRPAVQTYRGARQSFELSPKLSAALRGLSQQEEATLFMVLLAAFAVLLYRYTGQPDLVVGSGIANRNRAEIEGLIGFFVNTLVLRTDLSGNPTFREVVRRVRQVTLEAYDHQDLPFEKLVDEFQPERNLSHTPLFQVMFLLQNAPMPADVPGLTTRLWGTDTGTAKFDLTLSVEDAAPGLSGTLEYNSDLFDATTISRILENLWTLLEGIVADPGCRVSALPVLTAEERRRVVEEWNETRVDDAGPFIHELVAAQAARTPDATAVVLEGQHLSYRELNARANQLAHHLQGLGVGPETLVGILMARSVEMVVGLIGILKAGGAYVPLDPTYPPARLAFMLADARPPVLLCQKALLATLPDGETQVVCLDAGWPDIARQSPHGPVSGVGDDNLAYVIYTSGSTGAPKGAMNTHAGIRNRLLWIQATYPLAETDRVLQKTPLSFDVSVWEFFWPLQTGACLVVARPEGHKDSAYLAETIAEQHVTVLHFVPSMLQVFVETPGVGALGSLRRVICSGEALPFSLQERFFSRLGAELDNLYGPTEAAVDVTFWPCRREDGRRVVPIGWPIANIQLYILDAHLQPTPIGVPGELHIGGVGLARGYHNRPDLTAATFIPNPFSAAPGARLYKTGDLARYLPDGAIEYLGRLDHQVKVRGFRIELGEIETALALHPAVREAVVLAREDTPGDKRLVAYVVAAPGRRPEVGELRAWLQGKLPEYMLPAAFVTLEALPLLPNGKVNRRALPPPDRTRPDLDKTFVAPRTPVEETLAQIWAQVLGLDQVGIHDRFFELGGDSILSIQVVARANERGLRLTPRQMFQHPTIAELAAAANTAPVVQVAQEVVVGTVPLTPIQRWFLERNLPDPHHFNQAVLLEARQAVDPALLNAAVGHLLAHHDALRLRFHQEGIGWQPGLDVVAPFTWLDVSQLPTSARKAAMDAAAADAQASLDLQNGPLVRAVLFAPGPAGNDRLLIVIHHLVVDWVSWRVLLEDLQTAYQQLDQGQAVRLPAKATSFKQWAERLAEHARSDQVRGELAYWLVESRRRVVGLPVDDPAGRDANSASTRVVSVALDKAATRSLLREVPQAYNTRIDDVLLTALAQTLTGWTGSRLLLVDLEGHGRQEVFDDLDLSRTVGWFTSIYPVLLDLENVADWGEMLQSVKEQLRCVPGSGRGYGLLRYLSGDADAMAALCALPPAEVVFNYLGQFDRVLPEHSLFSLVREPVGPVHSPRGTRSHLLEIDGFVADGQLLLEWAYSENVHRRATIERLATSLVESLRALIAHCQEPDSGGYTPADFPQARLSQKELDRFIARVGELGSRK